MYFFFLMLVIMVSLIFVFLYILLSKSYEDKEISNSPYECGFDVISGTRVNFSYRFFLISILFLIFDVEISLLFPLPFLWGELIVILGSFFFLVILMVGLLYEYKNGALEWL